MNKNLVVNSHIDKSALMPGGPVLPGDTVRMGPCEPTRLSVVDRLALGGQLDVWELRGHLSVDDVARVEAFYGIKLDVVTNAQLLNWVRLSCEAASSVKVEGPDGVDDSFALAAGGEEPAFRNLRDPLGIIGKVIVERKTGRGREVVSCENGLYSVSFDGLLLGYGANDRLWNYFCQPDALKSKAFTFEGVTGAGCLQHADEMALERGLVITSQQMSRNVNAWHIEVHHARPGVQKTALNGLLAALSRALPPFNSISCDMGIRIDHPESDTHLSNRTDSEWAGLKVTLEAEFAKPAPNARPIAEASVAASKAREQEQEALRYELAKPPRGYSVAVWNAFLATEYEKREKVQPIDLVAKRFEIEAGRVVIPKRLLAADRQCLEKPLHAYRFDRRGGR